MFGREGNQLVSTKRRPLKEPRAAESRQWREAGRILPERRASKPDNPVCSSSEVDAVLCPRHAQILPCFRQL